MNLLENKRWAEAIAMRIASEWELRDDWPEDAVLMEKTIAKLLTMHPEECEKLIGTGIIESDFFNDLKPEGVKDNEAYCWLSEDILIVCPEYPDDCRYIRFVENGKEVAYWHAEEWQNEPANVMGAIAGALMHAVSGNCISESIKLICRHKVKPSIVKWAESDDPEPYDASDPSKYKQER